MALERLSMTFFLPKNDVLPFLYHLSKFVTLYTPKYMERPNGVKSEHYAKFLKRYPLCRLFYLTNQEKKGIL